MRLASTFLVMVLILFVSCKTTGPEIHHYGYVRVNNLTTSTLSGISLCTKISKNEVPERYTSFQDLLSGSASEYVRVEVETATEALFGNTSWRQIEDCRLTFSDGVAKRFTVFAFGGGPGDPGSGILKPDLYYSIDVDANAVTLVKQ